MQARLRVSVAVLAIVVTACTDQSPPTSLSAVRLASLAAQPDVVVNTTSDVADFGGAQQVGDLPGPDGLVTLREAITAANNTAEPQVIGFSIPTDDPGFDGIVFTIKPASPLPVLSGDGITINGATQAGYTGNTNGMGPEIVVDGSLLDTSLDATGVNIASRGNWIHGLVVENFAAGIDMAGEPAVGNVVTGCFIGTDASGTAARPNRQFGVGSRNGASANRIGGPRLEDRNIISGNSGGVFLGHDTYGNLVEGNFIGTDVTGRGPVGNDYGITSKATVYRTLIVGNLVSGNKYTGIFIGNDTHDMQIQHNLIGTDVVGNPVLGNGVYGISMGAGELFPPPREILIGGDLVSEGNLISGNFYGGIIIGGVAERIHVVGNTISANHASPGVQGTGVAILGQLGEVPGVGNSVRRNRIFGNDALGIDLGDDGVTPNDAGDLDTGANNLLNFPVLTSAKATPGRLIVQGTIDTPNPKTVTLEFFANPMPTPGGDPSGYGEGAVFLGTDRPNAQGKFTATLPTVAPGTLISATATDADGNTSEFAANIEARRP